MRGHHLWRDVSEINKLRESATRKEKRLAVGVESERPPGRTTANPVLAGESHPVRERVASIAPPSYDVTRLIDLAGANDFHPNTARHPLSFDFFYAYLVSLLHNQIFANHN